MIPSSQSIWTLVGLLGQLLVVSSYANAQPTNGVRKPDSSDVPTTTHETTIGAIKFTHSASLMIQRVAAEPLIRWPVVADWDQDGNLIVVESGGVGWPIQEHNEKKLHRVVRLVDEDKDGVFDQRIVAADNLPFTEGVLCLGDSMLVSSPPHILKLTDTTNDGFCNQREIWFDGQTVTNCANDLHGPYLGRDGWVYWCKGAFGEQTHQLLGGDTLNDSAAHVFRRRMEGGPIESLVSGGMDNPVELAITPEGEKFFTSTFLQHPADGLRDGIAHAVLGGVHGKDHSALDGVVRTGPLNPIMTHLGPAAPSGLACIESQRLHHSVAPGTSERILLSAQFNLQKVAAHVLQGNGASFQTQNVDLLVADRVDFHPTDILEDADGSLIVIDTGGWYDLCCPTSRVDQTTAAGGIYRLIPSADIRANIPVDNEPNSLAGIDGLFDPRPWVRRSAKLRLMEHADAKSIDALSALISNPSLVLDRKLQALWALSAIGTGPALDAIAECLKSDQASMIAAGCHAVAINEYAAAKPLVEQLVVSNKSLQVVRAAAEALAKIGDADSIEALMKAGTTHDLDPILRHSIHFAMLEIDSPKSVARSLKNKSPGHRSLALSVLNLFDDTTFLTEGIAVAALEEKLPPAYQLLADHPEWASDVLPTMLQQLASGADDRLYGLLRAWRDIPAVQKAVAQHLRFQNSDEELTQLIECFRGTQLPISWAAPMEDMLSDRPRFVVRLLEEFDLSPDYCKRLCGKLIALAHRTIDTEIQLHTLAVLPQNTQLDNAPLLRQLIDRFASQSSTHAHSASRAIERLQLTEEAAKQLSGSLEKVAPRYLLTALSAVSSARVDAIDQSALIALCDIPAAKTLPLDELRNLYKGRSKSIQQLASTTAEKLFAPPEDVRIAVEERLQELPSGDPVRGLQVFRSAKAACSGCHQMGYVGSRIGPELTRIGNSRTAEALLEAILFPSARLEQSYHPTRILTADGRIYNGLVTKEDSTQVRIRLTADREISLATSEIEQQEPSSLSVMPAGMSEVLTPQEMADVLALLESAK